MQTIISGVVILVLSLITFIVCNLLELGDLGILLTFLILVVGLAVLLCGLISGGKDFLTLLFGKKTYAFVTDVRKTNSLVYNQYIYESDFNVYDESGKPEVITTKIGTNKNKFPLGTYVELKYYKGNIYRIKSISSNFVPNNIKNMIKKEIDDTVVILGMKYKRIINP